ncbi:MAG: host-nuclease inhibitor Gam family protein [Thermodesulfobacteriota bacterium]
MARKRIEGTRLESWNQVDDCLRQIGVIDRKVGLMEAAANEDIDKIKARSKALAAPLLEKKAGLELAVKEFCEANRSEFAKVKTRVLTFGSVGFRQSTRIIVKRVADTLQALKDLGLSSCIRIKEELDKEAMKNLSTETLAEVGAGLKTQNAFGYEINQERIKEIE